MIKRLRRILNAPVETIEAKQVWVVERAITLTPVWEILSIHSTAEAAEKARTEATLASPPIFMFSITSYMMDT